MKKYSYLVLRSTAELKFHKKSYPMKNKLHLQIFIFEWLCKSIKIQDLEPNLKLNGEPPIKDVFSKGEGREWQIRNLGKIYKAYLGWGYSKILWKMRTCLLCIVPCPLDFLAAKLFILINLANLSISMYLLL